MRAFSLVSILALALCSSTACSDRAAGDSDSGPAAKDTGSPGEDKTLPTQDKGRPRDVPTTQPDHAALADGSVTTPDGPASTDGPVTTADAAVATKCKDSSTCKGYSCSQNICRTSCFLNSHCAKGYACSGNGTCAKPSTCTSDAQCKGYKCDNGSKTCRVACIPLLPNQCASGYTCITFQCLKK